jgi:hypothetical protein
MLELPTKRRLAEGSVYLLAVLLSSADTTRTPKLIPACIADAVCTRKVAHANECKMSFDIFL